MALICNFLYISKNFYFFSYYLLIQFDYIANEDIILPTQRLWHNGFIVLKIIMVFCPLIDCTNKLIYQKHYKLLFPLKSNKIPINFEGRNFSKANYLKLISYLILALIGAIFDGSVAPMLDIVIDQNSNSTPLFKCINETECDISNTTIIYKCLYHIEN